MPKCQKCGVNNPDTSRFCMGCGNILPPPASGNMSVPVQNAPVYQQAPVSYQVATQYGNNVNRSNSRTKGFNLWGPFTGYGMRQTHESWVLDGQGYRAKELVNLFQSHFAHRNIPNTTMQYQFLTAKGMIVEKRPFFVIQRRLVRMFLYIDQFGNDLYISLVPYLESPKSKWKITFHIFLLLYSTLLYPAILFLSGMLLEYYSSSGSSVTFIDSLLIGNFILTLLMFPVYFLGQYYSVFRFFQAIYNRFKHKDFWRKFRKAPTEFDEDDLKALELAVRQTLKSSMNQIGLDFENMMQSDTHFFWKQNMFK